jgi:hypothetical protein
MSHGVVTRAKLWVVTAKDKQCPLYRTWQRGGDGDREENRKGRKKEGIETERHRQRRSEGQRSRRKERDQKRGQEGAGTEKDIGHLRRHGAGQAR